jgi:hypothetical protein
MLYNEDKAVGVWVEAEISRGLQVDFVDLGAEARKRSGHVKGFDYEWFAGLRIHSTPMAVYHRLSPQEMACMWTHVQKYNGIGFQACKTHKPSTLQMGRGDRKRRHDEMLKFSRVAPQ